MAEITRGYLRRNYGVSLPRGFNTDKLEVLIAGIELHYLTDEDVKFIASDACTPIKATNILITRRKQQ